MSVFRGAKRTSPAARLWPAAAGLAAGALAVALGLLYRRYTTPFPYTHRWMLDKELPHLTRENLMAIVDPKPGERILEIGPGTGLFSLPIASALAPEGVLEITDVQQEMLDHTMGAAAEQGITNVIATQGDARQLPYPDASFDAVFMVTVLGEIPDQNAALGEIARVLRPQGRLVVGEFLIDWHAVRVGALRRRAGRAGLTFERRDGPHYSYLARFAKAAQNEAAALA